MSRADSNSNFPFISNSILRQNLDEAFDHIIILLPFSESETYNEPAKSAFRKTIIIYTGSIVEALLFAVMNGSFSDEDIAEYYSNWELKEKHVICQIGKNNQAVSGKYTKVKSKTSKEKMNLKQIMNFLKDKKIIKKPLYDKVEKLRNLRNEQHIGTHKTVRSYLKNDLEEAFSIAKDVKEFAKNNL